MSGAHASTGPLQRCSRPSGGPPLHPWSERLAPRVAPNGCLCWILRPERERDAADALVPAPPAPRQARSGDEAAAARRPCTVAPHEAPRAEPGARLPASACGCGGLFRGAERLGGGPPSRGPPARAPAPRPTSPAAPPPPVRGGKRRPSRTTSRRAPSAPRTLRAPAPAERTCYLVDPASSHMLVSKIKPCMCKYELIQTVKLRMAH